jgi:hypothetical protein
MKFELDSSGLQAGRVRSSDISTGASMKPIRNFAYAFVLALSALTTMPSLAWAQEAAGKFNLPHEVYWQNARVPAGVYRFSIEPRGPAKLLVISKIEGGAGFMIVANDNGPDTDSGPGRLTLVSQSGRSYVSAMELPAFGMTLRFTVPPESTAKVVATAHPASVVAPAR